MSTRADRRLRTLVQPRSGAVAQDDTERLVADDHNAIEARLLIARQGIARGKAKPLEPLTVLLCDARRQAKATR